MDRKAKELLRLFKKSFDGYSRRTRYTLEYGYSFYEWDKGYRTANLIKNCSTRRMSFHSKVDAVRCRELIIIFTSMRKESEYGTFSVSDGEHQFWRAHYSDPYSSYCLSMFASAGKITETKHKVIETESRRDIIKRMKEQQK